MNKKKKYTLDQEEQEILDEFDVDNLSLNNELKQSELVAAKSAAANFLKKSERINIRLNAFDLNHIKQIAAKEGIPYQTLISSVLHKFAANCITNKRKV